MVRIGNPNEIREGLLRLLHRAVTHCELRSPGELLMLTEAYANILHPDRPHAAPPPREAP